MKTIDFLCGQNWVDQFAYNLGRTTFSDASGLTLSEIADTFGLGLVNASFQWDLTPQGDDVWNLRNARMKHYYGRPLDNATSFRHRNLDDDPLLPT